LATYVVVVGSFLVYFYLQNQSKTALRKKLYELEEAERAKAKAFIYAQQQDLLRDMVAAKNKAEKEKNKGLSRAKIMERKAEEEEAYFKRMEIKPVYSTSLKMF